MEVGFNLFLFVSSRGKCNFSDKDVLFFLFNFLVRNVWIYMIFFRVSILFRHFLNAFFYHYRCDNYGDSSVIVRYFGCIFLYKYFGYSFLFINFQESSSFRGAWVAYLSLFFRLFCFCFVTSPHFLLIFSCKNIRFFFQRWNFWF